MIGRAWGRLLGGRSVQPGPSQPGLKRRMGPFSLTRRILAINVLAIALLGGGMLYLDRYERGLIVTELAALRTQADIFAAALSEGAVLDSPGEDPVLAAALAQQMTRRLVEPTRIRARLFGTDGNLIADSRVLGQGITVHQLPPPSDTSSNFGIANLLDGLASLLRARDHYPDYAEHWPQHAADYPEVENALDGRGGQSVRANASGGLVLSVTAPVRRYKEVLGAVLLSVGSADLERQVRSVRFDILRIFLAVLGVTILLSLYLAGTIARPVRRLAEAAEQVRRGQGRQVAIPDFTHRRDEIGELSGALAEMTGALWRRMDAIERFAADVAHEIKNPLTSVRSAVETATRLNDPAQQKKLLTIILDDVQRLDRLISDISDASRLDAEMSRLERAPVPLARMLEMLVDVYRTTARDDDGRIEFVAAENGSSAPARVSRDDLMVSGMEGRLVQVFRNLIANALSFNPPGGTIRIVGDRGGDTVVVTIEDDGPGIPDAKLVAIFDRFYTERPAGEKFGTHSGLGLSISKQIVEAHGGTIVAENRRDAAGRVIGARFIVRLPQAGRDAGHGGSGHGGSRSTRTPS
ncbi:MAG TPA: stimulus-sensing domain-containing protein [Stellaceae bacterium]|nr:stimulus-sensing domain-containing protein [Stellaceae bacterium]